MNKAEKDDLNKAAVTPNQNGTSPDVVTREIFDNRAALARAEGEAVGLREALRVAEAALQESRRNEEEVARRLTRAEAHTHAADQRAGEALTVMHGLVARVEQMQKDRAAEGVELAAEHARLAAAQAEVSEVEKAAAAAVKKAEEAAKDAIQRAEQADKRCKESERQAEAATARLDTLQQDRLQQLRASADTLRAAQAVQVRPLWQRLFQRS